MINHEKLLLSSFPMNGHTAGLHPQSKARVMSRGISFKTLKTNWNQRKPSCNNGSVLSKITLLPYFLKTISLSFAFDGLDGTDCNFGERNLGQLFQVKPLCCQKMTNNYHCFDFSLIESFDIFFMRIKKLKVRVLSCNFSWALTRNRETYHGTALLSWMRPMGVSTHFSHWGA